MVSGGDPTSTLKNRRIKMKLIGRKIFEVIMLTIATILLMLYGAGKL